MHILQSLLSELKEEFATSRKSEERGPWFIYTLLAIILPFTSSRTFNLLRALEIVYGFSIRKKILLVYGITEDSMESALEQAVEAYSGTRNQR
jgi:hypothetical protein